MDKTDLIRIDTQLFRYLKKGDTVYYQLYSNSTLERCEVIFASWLFSGDVLSSKTNKPFFYYQVSFKNKYNDVRHFDSICNQFEIRPIYITKELKDILIERKAKRGN